MDDVDMKLSNGAASRAASTPLPSSTSQPTPTATRRRSVSFPASAEPPHASKESPATAKILARKPTPFNNDLAATIRESGFGATLAQGDDQSPTQQSPSNTVNPPLNFDVLGEACDEEEDVDPEEAERARQISLGYAPPPPTKPSS